MSIVALNIFCFYCYCFCYVIFFFCAQNFYCFCLSQFYLFIFRFLSTNMYTYVCKYVCTFVNIYVCMYIYIHGSSANSLVYAFSRYIHLLAYINRLAHILYVYMCGYVYVVAKYTAYAHILRLWLYFNFGGFYFLLTVCLNIIARVEQISTVPHNSHYQHELSSAVLQNKWAHTHTYAY